ncbi:19890_t:CDS:2, partial [Gigaspora margarita]
MEKRNGVLNYTYFIKSMHPEESAFPIKKNHLKEYLTYKVEKYKMTAQTLKLYIMNIKAHNKALGFGWNYHDLDAITKEIWNKTALPFNSYNLNSLDINTTDTFPLSTGIDSVIQKVISCELYDLSSSGAHAFIPLPSINDLNTISLPIDTNSYIQQLHSQSSTRLQSCIISKLENQLFDIQNQVFDVQKQIFDVKEQISDILKQISIINS